MIMRAEQKRKVTGLSCFEQRLPGLGLAHQFCPVTALELRPFIRVMIEPTSQPVTGRDVFEPASHVQRLLLDAPRPQTFNKKSTSVSLLDRFIDSFDSNHGRSPMP